MILFMPISIVELGLCTNFNWHVIKVTQSCITLTSAMASLAQNPITPPAWRFVNHF